MIYNKGVETALTMNSNTGLAAGFNGFGGVDFEGTPSVDTGINVVGGKDVDGMNCVDADDNCECNPVSHVGYRKLNSCAILSFDLNYF